MWSSQPTSWASQRAKAKDTYAYVLACSGSFCTICTKPDRAKQPIAQPSHFTWLRHFLRASICFPATRHLLSIYFLLSEVQQQFVWWRCWVPVEGTFLLYRHFNMEHGTWTQLPCSMSHAEFHVGWAGWRMECGVGAGWDEHRRTRNEERAKSRE